MTGDILLSSFAILRSSCARVANEEKSAFRCSNAHCAERLSRIDRWGVYVISHVSGHISTHKCTKAPIGVDRLVVGTRIEACVLNSCRARRMTMVQRLVLPERTFPRRFMPPRDEWGRIFGDWVPVTRLGPGRLSASANHDMGEGIKNGITITNTVSARDSSDKYSRGTKVHFFRGEAYLFTCAKIPSLPLRTGVKLNCHVITINDNQDSQSCA